MRKLCSRGRFKCSNQPIIPLRLHESPKWLEVAEIKYAPSEVVPIQGYFFLRRTKASDNAVQNRKSLPSDALTQGAASSPPVRVSECPLASTLDLSSACRAVSSGSSTSTNQTIEEKGTNAAGANQGRKQKRDRSHQSRGLFVARKPFLGFDLQRGAGNVHGVSPAMRMSQSSGGDKRRGAIRLIKNGSGPQCRPCGKPQRDPASRRRLSDTWLSPGTTFRR